MFGLLKIVNFVILLGILLYSFYLLYYIKQIERLLQDYHQINEGIKLTVEDLKWLNDKLSGIVSVGDFYMGSDEWYEEILKQFNEKRRGE